MGNGPSSVPYGAQISAVNATLVCTTDLGAGNFAFQTYVSATLPTVAGSGQQIYISDLVAHITLPQIIFNNSNLGFYSTYNLVLQLSNAEPSSYSIQSGGINFISEHDIVIADPNSRASTHPPIGPFTVGEAGTTADLSIGSFDLILEYQKADVPNPPPPYSATASCSQQGVQYIISSTVIDDSSGPALLPSIGAPASFPPLAAQERATTANLAVNCTQSELTQLTNAFNLTTGGVGPALLQPGQTFSLTNFNHFLTVPDIVMLYLVSFYGTNSTALIVTLSGLNGRAYSPIGLAFNLDSASPAQIDASRDFTASEPDRTANPLSSIRYINPHSYSAPYNGSLTFPLPFFGDLELGSFTAAANGTFAVNVTELNAVLQGVDLNYGMLAGIENVHCSVLGGSALLSASISDYQLPADLQY